MQRKTFSSTLLLAALAAAVWFVSAGGAAPPPPTIVTGQDAGWPDVRGWNAQGGAARQWAPWGESPLAFSPYATYQQGVRVAVGDVNGDGRPEIITAPGKSAFTELRVFDGKTFHQVGSMLPFKDAAWWAGAYVATGDTNGDGRAEIVEGLDAGCCTTLHVLDGQSGDDLSGFFPYGSRSEVGARVTSADVNGDGKAEILAVPLGSARVSVYPAAGGPAFRSIDAFGADRAGPVSIAAGNVVGDSRAELIAAAPTDSGAEVKIIDVGSGETRASFYPYGNVVVSSVEVALGDVNATARSTSCSARRRPGEPRSRRSTRAAASSPTSLSSIPRSSRERRLPQGISTVTAARRSSWVAARRPMLRGRPSRMVRISESRSTSPAARPSAASLLIRGSSRAASASRSPTSIATTAPRS